MDEFDGSNVFSLVFMGFHANVTRYAAMHHARLGLVVKVWSLTLMTSGSWDRTTLKALWGLGSPYLPLTLNEPIQYVLLLPYFFYKKNKANTCGVQWCMGGGSF